MDLINIKKMRSEDIRLEASQRLIELLSNIEHTIAYTLLDKIRYKEYGRISYLDFGNENDNVSYIINNKFFELTDSNHDTWREKVWTEKRTNLKVGKFIKMLFEDYFPVNQPKDAPVPKPRVDIESFVNMFKAEREKNVNYSRFEIVSGEEIRKWYKQDNYSRFANSETPLGKSCMRYAESSKFLKMYSANKDIFSMLILKDDAGKLKGRALVWNLDSPKDRIFMDRIYTVNDYDIEVFKQYAKDNGWLYRVEQRFGWFNKIADPTNGMVFDSKELLLQVTLSKCPEIDYDYYPYLDTLSIYNKETHILNNNGELRRKSGHILLTDYQGRYHCEVDERPRVYSSVYNEEILEEEAVYIEIDDTYCLRGDEVTVHNTGGRMAYRNSQKIVQSRILGNIKYFMKEECVYSEYLGTHVFKKSVVNAFMDNKEKTAVIIHKNLIGVDFEEKDGIVIYSKELISKRKEQEMLKFKKMSKKSSNDWYDAGIMLEDMYFGRATRSVEGRPVESRRVEERSVETRRVEGRPVEVHPVDAPPLRGLEDRPVERPESPQPVRLSGGFGEVQRITTRQNTPIDSEQRHVAEEERIHMENNVGWITIDMETSPNTYGNTNSDQVENTDTSSDDNIGSYSNGYTNIYVHRGNTGGSYYGSTFIDPYDTFDEPNDLEEDSAQEEDVDINVEENVENEIRQSVRNEINSELTRFGHIDSNSLSSYYDDTVRQIYEQYILARRRRRR